MTKGGGDGVVAQGSNEGGDLPVTARHFTDHPARSRKRFFEADAVSVVEVHRPSLTVAYCECELRITDKRHCFNSPGTNRRCHSILACLACRKLMHKTSTSIF